MNPLNKQIFSRFNLLSSSWDIPKNFTGIIEFPDRDKAWYLNGKLHREDGPAIEYFDGTKKWFLNGLIHRTDGPAIEHITGDKIWYLNGEFYSKKKCEKEIEKINHDKFIK